MESTEDAIVEVLLFNDNILTKKYIFQAQTTLNIKEKYHYTVNSTDTSNEDHVNNLKKLLLIMTK